MRTGVWVYQTGLLCMASLTSPPSQPNHIFLIVSLRVRNRKPGGIGLCPNLYLNH